MIKCIFWTQIIVAVGCEGIAIIPTYLVGPLAHFDTELVKLEGIMAKEGHFGSSQWALSAMHYFISAIHTGGQVNFYMLQVSSVALFFGGVIGLQKLYKIEKANFGR